MALVSQPLQALSPLLTPCKPQKKKNLQLKLAITLKKNHQSHPLVIMNLCLHHQPSLPLPQNHPKSPHQQFHLLNHHQWIPTLNLQQEQLLTNPQYQQKVLLRRFNLERPKNPHLSLHPGPNLLS
jgi:hypothetical protein